MDAVATCANRFTDGEVITIQLEDTKGTYLVQKALLCCASDYFIAAVDGRFKEGTDRTLRLPGCNTETFELFLYWASYHDLPDLSDGLELFAPEHEYVQIRLVRLWCFADACLIPKLKNAAMKDLLPCIRKSRVSVEALRIAYGSTAPDSVLREALMLEMSSQYVIGFKNECPQLRYTEDDVNALGSIPGLMRDLTGTLIITKGNGTNGTIAENDDGFMVC